MAKPDVKKVVLLHSKAKLDLYKSYLGEYLPILGHSPYVDVINIFDIFCGTGVYEDGNLGSPLIAAACIAEYEWYFEQKGLLSKPVKLFINDFDKNKVSSVREMIDAIPLKNCEVTPFNKDASEMFDIVANKINSFPARERSLIFIDPYGYSKIDKNKIFNLLKRKRSEIILFLPVAHMKRFTEEALTDYEKKAYENLRKFILEFFDEESKVIKAEKLDIFNYIEELRKAFSFNDQFYTASHYIERNKANYYALFFMGHHIYGLEKFIEAKWKNASLGQGFNQNKEKNTLFGDTLVEYDKNISIENLEKLFRKRIEQKEVTNIELYEFTLRHQFKPSHMNELLRQWKAAKKMQVLDGTGKIIENIKGFALNYDNFKTDKVSYIFRKR